MYVHYDVRWDIMYGTYTALEDRVHGVRTTKSTTHVRIRHRMHVNTHLGFSRTTRALYMCIIQVHGTCLLYTYSALLHCTHSLHMCSAQVH